jgi:hypothetical protein
MNSRWELGATTVCSAESVTTIVFDHTVSRTGHAQSSQLQELCPREIYGHVWSKPLHSYKEIIVMLRTASLFLLAGYFTFVPLTFAQDPPTDHRVKGAEQYHLTEGQKRPQN